MIPLPSGFLESNESGLIPCEGQPFSLNVVGNLSGVVDGELLQNAAVAVMHYFQHELNRTHITVEEFTNAMQAVLKGFGLNSLEAVVKSVQFQPRLAEVDLRSLVSDGLELFFFQRLRDELRRQLQPGPDLLRFHGLRECVITLMGVRRWSHRCQAMSDRIVDHLRESLQAEDVSKPCSLIVQ